MRVLLAASMIGTALGIALAMRPVSASSGQLSRLSNSLERPFVVGGRIRMTLTAGAYRITGIREKRIQLAWNARQLEQLSDVRVSAGVLGSDATLVTEGSLSGLRMNIRVPERTDLTVRLTTGTLAVEGIEGDKDIESRSGEVDVDLGPENDYGGVEASVWAGSLQAPSYDASRRGHRHSLELLGAGPYRVRVHVDAGQVHLYNHRVFRR